MDAMNPRYLAYCKAMGRTPEEQMEWDKNEFPGGCMLGFIFWIERQKRLLFQENPKAFAGETSGSPIWDQKEWDKFLGVSGEYQEMRDVIDELSPIWTMRDGRTIAVIGMEDSHVMNALAMVRHQEAAWQRLYQACLIEDDPTLVSEQTSLAKKTIERKRYWIRIFTLELERRVR